jgi:ribonuclease HI
LLNANIYSDSELVVKQIKGEYRVKHPRMQELYKEAMDQFQYMDTWTFNHILRDKNDSADRLAKSGRLKGKK